MIKRKPQGEISPTGTDDTDAVDTPAEVVAAPTAEKPAIRRRRGSARGKVRAVVEPGPQMSKADQLKDMLSRMIPGRTVLIDVLLRFWRNQIFVPNEGDAFEPHLTDCGQTQLSNNGRKGKSLQLTGGTFFAHGPSSNGHIHIHITADVDIDALAALMEEEWGPERAAGM